MKKITKYLIIPLFSLFAFFLFSNNKASAYSLDSNGNLVSDNLISEDDIYYFEGTRTPYNGVVSVTFTFKANTTYTFKIFDYESSGFGLYFNEKLSANGAVDCGYWSSNSNIRTCTIGTSDISFNNEQLIKIASGSISDVGNLMIVRGNTIVKYEEYGAVWYSQNNYNQNYSEGYSTATNSYLNIVKNKSKELNTDELVTPLDYFCTTYTSGAVDCTDAFKGYVQDAFGYGKVVGNEEGYNEGHTDGQAVGYEKAVKDGKSLGTFIPNLLGGIGSFFLMLLNIDFLGFNLLSVIGILITILGIIVVIKFIKG